MKPIEQSNPAEIWATEAFAEFRDSIDLCNHVSALQIEGIGRNQDVVQFDTGTCKLDHFVAAFKIDHRELAKPWRDLCRTYVSSAAAQLAALMDKEVMYELQTPAIHDAGAFGFKQHAYDAANRILQTRNVPMRDVWYAPMAYDEGGLDIVFFHPEAVTVVNKLLGVKKGRYEVGANGFSIRASVEETHDATLVTLDALYGIKVTKPEWACKVSINA